MEEGGEFLHFLHFKDLAQLKETITNITVKHPMTRAKKSNICYEHKLDVLLESYSCTKDLSKWSKHCLNAFTCYIRIPVCGLRQMLFWEIH